MPVLCDFTLILGDAGPSGQLIQIGNPVSFDRFGTGGRRADEPALLIYSVLNMGGTADVVINNVTVGTITENRTGFYTTQMIAMLGSRLNDGENEMVIRNMTHAFLIKDIMCFFHQSA